MVIGACNVGMLRIILAASWTRTSDSAQGDEIQIEIFVFVSSAFVSFLFRGIFGHQ